MDTATLLNGIREQASPAYKAAVPKLVSDADMQTITKSATFSKTYNVGGTTYTSDVRVVGQAITALEAIRNEFLDALVNRIGMVMFQSFTYTNKLKKFKKGMLEYGEVIEEIFVQIAEAQDYSWKSGETEDNPFKREIPDVKVYFHKMNSQKKFRTTVTEEQINLAFINANGVYTLVSEIIDSLYKGYEVYEWKTMKATMADAFNASNITTVDIDAPTTKEAMEDMVKKARELYLNFGMPSTEYNKAGVLTTTPDSRIHVIYTSKIASSMDVDVLAKAFNMDRTTFLGQSTVIDKFADGMEDVQLLILDENFFQVYDKLFRVTSIFNSDMLYYNYVLHVWQVYSYSLLVNAVALKTATEIGG